MHVDGLNGNRGGGNGSGSNSGSGSLADQVVDSALRYKAQAPLVESLLREVGLEGGDIKELTKNLHSDFGKKPTASASPDIETLNTTTPDQPSNPVQE
jgi:hypothetical protein